MNNSPKILSREEIFKRIFSEIKFPFLDIDLFELSEAIASRNIPISHISIPLFIKDDKVDVLRGALKGILKNINPTDEILKILEKSEIILNSAYPKKSIKAQIESKK